MVPYVVYIENTMIQFVMTTQACHVYQLNYAVTADKREKYRQSLQ